MCVREKTLTRQLSHILVRKRSVDTIQIVCTHALAIYIHG